MHAGSGFVSAAEAASKLKVHPSRVRAMAQARQLDSKKIAGRWLIDQASLDRRCDSEVVDGRPYSPANAWALLCLADGRQVDWVGPSALSRLRRKLKSYGLFALAPRLRLRAQVMSFWVHPAVFRRLVMEPDVVKAGAGAAAEYGIDIQASDELDIYIPRRRVDDIVAKYQLKPSDRPNIVLRVVEDDQGFDWRRGVGGALVAVDLFESQDPRSRRAAREFLERFDSSASRS